MYFISTSMGLGSESWNFEGVSYNFAEFSVLLHFFTPPPLLLLMTHNEKMRLKALP